MSLFVVTFPRKLLFADTNVKLILHSHSHHWHLELHIPPCSEYIHGFASSTSEPCFFFFHLCILNSKELVLYHSNPELLTHSHHTAAGGCCFQVIRLAADIAALALLSHPCSSLSCHISKMSGFGSGHMAAMWPGLLMRGKAMCQSVH